MSVEAMAWAFQQTTRSSGQRCVLLAIANRANEEGICWPSATNLAAMSGVNERQVRSHLESLVDDGLLQKLGRRRRANGHLGTWWLWLPLGVRPTELPDGSAVEDETSGSGLPVVEDTTSGSPLPVDQRQSTSAHEQPSLNLQENKQPVRFEEFWKLYPRHEGKAAAESKWKSATKKVPAEQIIEGLRRRVDWWKLSRTETKFIPYAATWLNQQRWADELPPVERDKATSAARANRDRADRMRLEVEEAIHVGDPDQAWEIIRQRAAADGNATFLRVADILDRRGDEAIAAVAGITQGQVREIRQFRDGIRAAARGESVALRYSLMEGTDGDSQP